MKSRGFTMLEILITLALLAILLIAAFTGWRLQISKAKDTERKVELNELRSAIINYSEDHGLPDNEDIVCDSPFLQPYMEFIPCDPLNKDDYRYVYDKINYNSFRIYAKLENENDQAIAASGCSDGCGTNQNYYVSSGNDGDGGDSVVEGVEPICGTETKYCFANICSTCCPGVGYRCNGTGDRCIVDVSCGE